MQNIKKYIETLESEIESAIAQEVAGGLSYSKEKGLHVLFENRKHAKCFLEDMHKELLAEKTKQDAASIV